MDKENSRRSFLAHSPTIESPDGQRLICHLENVSRLAGCFCESFGMKEIGEICGLYHDLGKYSDAFQKRLSGSNIKVDHSTAGAFELFSAGNIPAAISVAGHHSGLPDLGNRNDLSDTFMARINQARAGTLEDYSAWKDEVEIPKGKKLPDASPLEYYYLIRMLFSSLTDADWLDTEAYFRNKCYTLPATHMKELRLKLDQYVGKWWEAKEDINIRRCRILRAAMDHGSDEPGLFTMAVPTGGGKTVSSMAFALNHAECHNKQRIIYVIPYCSILEQTQEVFERIFGKEYIIAHYSGAEYQRDENAVDTDTRAFSAENWEAPIILTTAVQFFESIYSSKPAKSRKLHNIANSVIIFDEAQMLPVPFLSACVASICQLVLHYRCTAVLCTATQPAIEPLLAKYAPGHAVRELCPVPLEMYDAFRRVRYVDEGLLTDEKLAENLLGFSQVLCVVNSRKQAQKLFSLLGEREGNYHLSTMMIPHDRKLKLKEIRERLKNGQDCRVVSTSLIEAGVDVDFPVVWRTLAGLDSIIQTGGRCNREGKRAAEDSIVHLFSTEAKAPVMLEQNIAASERILRQYRDIDSPEAIHSYFQFLLYTLKDDRQLDQREIMPCVEKLMFDTVAKRFHLIDGADCTVHIPVDEGEELVQRLKKDGPSRQLLRELGQYSVSVYDRYFKQLYEAGMIERISDNEGILLDKGLYSRETGLPFIISEQDQALLI